MDNWASVSCHKYGKLEKYAQMCGNSEKDGSVEQSVNREENEQR